MPIMIAPTAFQKMAHPDGIQFNSSVTLQSSLDCIYR